MKLYERIPKEKEDIFKYNVNWNIIAKHELLELKIKPWVAKKVKEYLGEEESNLISIVMKMLNNKCFPYEIIERIKSVLEEDTDVNLLI